MSNTAVCTNYCLLQYALSDDNLSPPPPLPLLFAVDVDGIRLQSTADTLGVPAGSCRRSSCHTAPRVTPVLGHKVFTVCTEHDPARKPLVSAVQLQVLRSLGHGLSLCPVSGDSKLPPLRRLAIQADWHLAGGCSAPEWLTAHSAFSGSYLSPPCQPEWPSVECGLSLVSYVSVAWSALGSCLRGPVQLWLVLCHVAMSSACPCPCPYLPMSRRRPQPCLYPCPACTPTPTRAAPPAAGTRAASAAADVHGPAPLDYSQTRAG